MVRSLKQVESDPGACWIFWDSTSSLGFGNRQRRSRRKWTPFRRRVSHFRRALKWFWAAERPFLAVSLDYNIGGNHRHFPSVVDEKETGRRKTLYGSSAINDTQLPKLSALTVKQRATHVLGEGRSGRRLAFNVFSIG